VGDASLLDPVAGNVRVGKSVRLRAATKRVERAWDYGPPDLAVALILELAADRDADPATRLEALQAIRKLRAKEDLIPALRSITSDANARVVTRILAARDLRDAGAVEEGEAALLSVAHDELAPPGLRERAAHDLSAGMWYEDMTLEDAWRLIGYGADGELPRSGRYCAAHQALRGLGESDDPDHLLSLARDRGSQAVSRAAAILNLGFLWNDARVSEIASALETIATDLDDERSLLALDSMATLDCGRATPVLAAHLRATNYADIAALAERVAAVIGDARAVRLMLRVPTLLNDPDPAGAAGADAKAEFVRRRRKASVDAFPILLKESPHFPSVMLLATSMAIEPEVRMIARACAFTLVAKEKTAAEIMAMLRDPATAAQTQEVLAWYLRYEPVELVGAALESVARYSEVPGHVRLTAIESLAVLQKSELAADLLVLAGGSTLPRPPLKSYYEISAEPHYRILARVACDTGFPELRPILIPAIVSLGAERVQRTLLTLATGSEPDRANTENAPAPEG
jgi:hypothetical protein